MPEISQVQKVKNVKKVKFSNSKEFYYTFQIRDEDGIHDLMFTKRQLLEAEKKYTKLKDSVQ